MMDLQELRAAWAADWQAMKDGTYVVPMPHPKKVVHSRKFTGGSPPAKRITEEQAERKRRIIEAYRRGDKMELIAYENGVNRMYVNTVVREAKLPYRKPANARNR